MLIPFGVFSAAGAGGGAAAGSYELISTTVLGSSQASVTFDVSTYASTYKHLQVRMTYRCAANIGGDNPQVRFNSDSTYTNYRSHQLMGNGSSATSQALQSTNYKGVVIGMNMPDAGSGSSQFGAIVTDILDPFSSSKNTTVRSLSGGTSYNMVSLNSGVWLNTATVTSLTFNAYPGDATNSIATGSRFSLYGIKG